MFRSALAALLLATVACTVSHAQNSGTRQPDYIVLHLSIEVNRPAQQVWKRVGDYCAIAEWLKVSCRYASGSGDVGTVRVINDTTLEPMVARTSLSYSYWQSAGTMAPDAYHGTVAVEPKGGGESTIYYTLFYDQNAIPAEERSSEHDRLTSRFQGALAAMKALAESQP